MVPGNKSERSKEPTVSPVALSLSFTQQISLTHDLLILSLEDSNKILDCIPLNEVRPCACPLELTRAGDRERSERAHGRPQAL